MLTARVIACISVHYFVISSIWSIASNHVLIDVLKTRAANLINFYLSSSSQKICKSKFEFFIFYYLSSSLSLTLLRKT